MGGSTRKRCSRSDQRGPCGPQSPWNRKGRCSCRIPWAATHGSRRRRWGLWGPCSRRSPGRPSQDLADLAVLTDHRHGLRSLNSEMLRLRRATNVVIKPRQCNVAITSNRKRCPHPAGPPRYYAHRKMSGPAWRAQLGLPIAPCASLSAATACVANVLCRNCSSCHATEVPLRTSSNRFAASSSQRVLTAPERHQRGAADVWQSRPLTLVGSLVSPILHLQHIAKALYTKPLLQPKAHTHSALSTGSPERRRRSPCCRRNPGGGRRQNPKGRGFDGEKRGGSPEPSRVILGSPGPAATNKVASQEPMQSPDMRSSEHVRSPDPWCRRPCGRLPVARIWYPHLHPRTRTHPRPLCREAFFDDRGAVRWSSAPELGCDGSA